MRERGTGFLGILQRAIIILMMGVMIKANKMIILSNEHITGQTLKPSGLHILDHHGSSWVFSVRTIRHLGYPMT